MGEIREEIFWGFVLSVTEDRQLPVNFRRYRANGSWRKLTVDMKLVFIREVVR